MCEQKQFENCKLYKDTLFIINSYTSAYFFCITHCRNKRCPKDGGKGKKNNLRNGSETKKWKKVERKINVHIKKYYLYYLIIRISLGIKFMAFGLPW